MSIPVRNLEKTVVEFFAGIGLMRLGLEKEKWSVIFSNDIDAQKKEMYETHFQDLEPHFHFGDIHEIPTAIVPTATLATASFPCNDLSLAGARNGLDGEQSSAFWGFVRILKGMKSRKPPIVLIENVPGFLSSNDGRDFRDAMLALNKLGYSVDPFIVDAACFVPQSRQRLFVVGQIQSPYNDSPISERFFESETRPPSLADFILINSDIQWTIRKLPVLPKRKKNLEDILESLSDAAPEWWSEERADYLLNQMSPRHREIADKMIAGKQWSYGTVFRRVRNERSMAELRVDGTAGCLRTPRGGSGRQILFKAGRGKYMARLLTPRECARLMGADNYKISAPLNQALFGFGDAVCVPVIEWIAHNYLNPLLKELNAPAITDSYDQKEYAAA